MFCSHWGYLNKKHCPDWLAARSVWSRFNGIRDYQRFIQDGVEKELEEIYRGAYQKPVLGSKEFSERIKERLGSKARVEADKPESKRMFSPGLEDIMVATAREYSQPVADLALRKRAGQNEARMVAIYVGRQLGGHTHEEIGKHVGLGNTSSVSSAYLAMKRRVGKEKRLARRVRRIEKALVKSKKRT